MKPILFNTEMVRAIIAGRKTQTRRIVKPQPVVGKGQWEWPGLRPKAKKATGAIACFGQNVKPSDPFTLDYSGRIMRGDILYVRETLYQNGELGLEYFADGEGIDEEIIPENHRVYRNYAFCKIPNIHMPKWAARIFLRITDVRVERLQDISEEDAIAEGVGAGFQMNAGWPDYTRIVNGACELTQDTAALSFQTLWDSIYGTPSPVKGDENEVVGYVVYPWDDEAARQFGATYRGKPLEVFVNPWVWAYTFERIEKP